MAARRTDKRDARGRFASTGGSRVKRASRKINRRSPHYLRGSRAKRCASVASAQAVSTPESMPVCSSAVASAARPSPRRED